MRKYENVSVDQLIPYARNARTHSDAQIKKIQSSIREFGFINPVLIDGNYNIIAGHGRVQAAEKEGLAEVPCIFVEDLTESQKKAYILADNRLSLDADWDMDLLKIELEDLQGMDFDLDLTGFNMDEIDALLAVTDSEEDFEFNDTAKKEEANKTLAERFGVPPFSVLDTRQGYWQDRKRAWISIGIKSELGRGEDGEHARTFGQDLMKGEHSIGENNNKISGVLFKSDSGRDPSYYAQKRKIEKELGHEISTQEFQEKYYQPNTEGSGLTQSGTSVFDPVLCELAYTWFSPDGGVIIDPFSGGSVRGVVAARLNREYHGNDLRQEQIDANRKQADEIEGLKITPTWYCGDSTNLDTILPTDLKADMIFSCPPYADLEVYSDNPNDLSTMDYDDFIKAYRIIIKKAVSRLKDNSFACFVVGDVRDKKGIYRNFVSDTIQAFIDAGMGYYNEGILVNTLGSLPVRVGKQFSSSRKFGKTHQNVLVFYQGDPKKISDRLGEIEIQFNEEETE